MYSGPERIRTADIILVIKVYYQIWLYIYSIICNSEPNLLQIFPMPTSKI